MLPPLVKLPAAAMAWAFWMVAEGIALVPIALVDHESDVGTIGGDGCSGDQNLFTVIVLGCQRTSNSASNYGPDYDNSEN